MKDKDKTKEQLIDELLELRKQNAELEKSKNEYKKEVFRESEGKYRALVENMNDALIMHDSKGKIISVNRKTCELLDYKKDDILGKQIAEFTSKASIKRLELHLKQLLEKGSLIFDSEAQKRDGSIIPVNISAKVVNIEGKKIVQSFLRDITERKRTERKLQESKKRHRELVELLPEMLVETDVKGNITFVNTAVLHASGYSKEDFEKGIKTHQMIIPKDRERHKNIFNKKIRGKDAGITEYTFKKIDGSCFPVIVHSNVITNDQGNVIGTRAIAMDITDRKIAERALQQSEEKYRLLVENAPSVLWKTSEKGVTVFISSNIKEVYGYTPEEIYADGYNSWLRRIHHDDLQEVEKSFQALFSKGKKFDVEYRIKRKDGEWIWAHDVASVVHEENGERYAYGVFTDITERKRAEEKIATSLKEKEVLLKEIHHRVKNNMQIVSSLLRLQSANIKDKGIREMFNASQSRIQSMSLIHEKLYQSKDFSRINFAQYIRSLIVHLFQTYRVNTNIVKLNIEMGDVFLDINTAIPCSLITNELVSNSLKYAFPEGKEGEVGIKLRKDKQGRFVLTVRDSGVGFPEKIDFRNPNTLGLQLVNDLVKQIKGMINLDRRIGTKFKVVF